MLFLNELGLECLTEEENFDVVANYVLRKGKPFYGYQGFYLYQNIGHAEIAAHIVPNDAEQTNECVNFSSHVMGNDFWRLTIADDGVMDEETDPLSKCVFFHNPEIESSVFPVHLMHADVLPSFMPGEKVTMQIQAFPYEIEYFKDEDSYHEKHNVKMMGNYVDFKDGNIFNMRIYDGCLIKATVKNVKKLASFDLDGNKKEFFAVTIETPYGDLALCHKEDIVPEEQREFIKVGSIVRTLCVLSGDVAVGEYQNGAVIDESHALKLFREAMTSHSFARCHKLFADDAKYVGMDGEVKCNGGDECVDYLEELARKMENRQLFIYHGTVVGECDDMKKVPYLPGKKVLIISYDTPATFRQMLALEMNPENKIARFVIQDCRHYDIQVDMEEEWERNEATAVNVLKECLDSGNATKMLNLVDKDAWFVHGSSVTARFGYGVVYMLDRIIEEVDKHNGIMNTYVVAIKDYKNKDSVPQLLPGKICLALSVGDLEQYEQLMAVQLNTKGEISAIQIVEDNNYEVTLIDPDEAICETYANTAHWTPVKIERTPEEWLELIKGWFNGDGEDSCEMKFYSGMEPECELKLDNGDFVRTFNDKESVFANIEVFANLQDNEVATIETKDGNPRLVMEPAYITLSTSERGRINKIYVFMPEM